MQSWQIEGLSRDTRYLPSPISSASTPPRIESSEDSVDVALIAEDLAIVEVPYIKEIHSLRCQISPRTFHHVQDNNTRRQAAERVALLRAPRDLNEFPTRQLDQGGGCMAPLQPRQQVWEL